MTNLPYTEKKRNISILLEQLSKSLNIDINYLTPIKEKLELIILSNNTLEDMLNNYFTLLESEMATLICKKITPGFQFGIKNDYFTFIGYQGTIGASNEAKKIDENTYFSFDSISKILTSVVTMMMIRDGKVTLESPINKINPEFSIDASIESILKFTAMIQTERRIDNLSREETIEILKRVRENVVEKNTYKNYYQYNDIGYMILRLSIPDFLERLDAVLNFIDPYNLTYKNLENKALITGGRHNLEHITPDTKGRDILFPGHTGMYGNIKGLLNLFKKVFFTNDILTKEELERLLSVPYDNPNVYNKDGSRAIGKNGSLQYMAKVGGIYRAPTNILEGKFSKIASCDFSELTTNKARASAGTCGSWVMGDNLSYQENFGTYIGGILTNPYSYVNIGKYPDTKNMIPNTNLVVNQNGVILGYSGMLNPYKEIIAEYGIILELLTAYIKNTLLDETINNKHTTYIKKLKKS